MLYLLDYLAMLVREAGVGGFRFDSTLCIRKSHGTNGECWSEGAAPNAWGEAFLRRATSAMSVAGLLSVADDLQRLPELTAPATESGFGFDLQADESLYFTSWEAIAEGNQRGLRDALWMYCNPPSRYVSYTSAHDPAGAHGKLTQRLMALPGATPALARQKAGLALVVTLAASCGAVMLLQGQETLDAAPFDNADPTPFDWDAAGVRFGEFELTRRLLALRAERVSLRRGGIEDLRYANGAGRSFGRRPRRLAPAHSPSS